MTFIDQIRRIERIDYLIRSKSTGTPAELAGKLNISQSQLFQIIRLMKSDMKAPVYYSKAELNYYYTENVRFICAFQPDKKNISNNQDF